MASRSPTLAEVLQTSIQTSLESVHTAIPAKVTRYNASLQQADVQPLIKQAYEDEFGERQVASLPVVSNCPVQFPGGGGFTLIYPLSEGDTGLLVFSQASLDKWLSTGGTVDPDIDHRHNLSDGIFIPGVNPFSSPRITTSPTNIVLGQDIGNQIHVGATGISLGAGATEPVIKGATFTLSVIGGLIAATTALGTATTAPGVIDAVLATAIQTYAAAAVTALNLITTSLSTIVKTV